MAHPENTRESPDVTSAPVVAPDVQQWLKPDTPEDVREYIVGSQRTVEHYRYSGPLPQAAEMELYEQVCPGAADRIIGMGEKALEIQAASMEGNIGLAKRSINASVGISAGMMLLAALCILSEEAWIAVPLGGIGILNLFARELIRKIRGE